MKDGLFPNDLANMMTPGESYRPSNGTEGMMFFDWFCENCKRDINGDCPIYAASLAFHKDDKEYPKEWVIDEDGQPTCTAYDEK